MSNFSGTFLIDLDGQSRELKMTFGVVERLERVHLKKPIVELLHEAAINRPSLTDVATVFHECLLANGDTRLKTVRDVGEALHKKGFSKYLELYIEVLAYALYGSDSVNKDATPDDSKKN